MAVRKDGFQVRVEQGFLLSALSRATTFHATARRRPSHARINQFRGSSTPCRACWRKPREIGSHASFRDCALGRTVAAT
jgi:hypothetical protein